jgi:hypothetical protein
VTSERPSFPTLGRLAGGLMGLTGLLGLLVVGCQREPPLVPVSGKLTLAGKPLSPARVQFVPDRSKGNVHGQEARGRVAADGTYTLSTGSRPGAMPGWYTVAVFAFEEVPEGGEPKPITWLAPPRYADPAQSGLSVEVTAQPKPNQYDFDLKP